MAYRATVVTRGGVKSPRRRPPFMRKSVATESDDAPSLAASPADPWLDLERLATAEVTSEHPEHPLEGAFRPGTDAGWMAAKKGQQTIRLHFDEPHDLHRILLEFAEPRHERTHEFTLSWAPSRHGPYQPIVRQQWNFNPQSASSESEDYTVNLPAVRALELVIRPDIGRGQALASLAHWAVA